MTTAANTRLLQTLTDPDVFGPWLGGASWAGWRAFISLLFNVTPHRDQHELILKATGRSSIEACMCGPREAWLVVGRRGGKSFVVAVIALLFACFRNYRSQLTVGEKGVVMIIASDRAQAKVVLGYIKGFLNDVPMLAGLVARRTAEAVHLTNGISIEVHTASFKSIRGRTVVAAVLDEVAFFPHEDAANPDLEILRALRPAMATIPGALLMAISSPYARRGELFRAFHDHFGRDHDPIFVWQAASAVMNPSIDPAVIAQAYADDEAVASAEYGAEFRRDIESFVSPEVVDAAIVPGRRELAPRSGVTYSGFVDPSGGSVDSFSLAIAHYEAQRIVLDVVRERHAPFAPDEVTREFAATLKDYGIREIRGDRYGGEFPVAFFLAAGITYRTSEHTKSDLYQLLLPLLNSARVELLDVPRLRAQLLGLERRTARSGKDSIDHMSRHLDDVANAVAGAVVSADPSRAPGPLVAFCCGPADLEYVRRREGREPPTQTLQLLRQQKSVQRLRELDETARVRAERVEQGTLEQYFPN